MKNLHLLPSGEKFARIFAQNIYITSDEEIKIGDWCLDLMNNTIYVATKVVVHNLKSLEYEEYLKKIILTTDQNLIKDGVQAIDNEFLKWFVKNLSCEKVEIEKYHGINTSNAEINAISGDGSLKWEGKSDLRDYKIIIPKTTQQIIDEDFSGGLEMGQIIPKEDKIYTEEDVKNAFLDGWQLRDGDLPFPKAKKKWFNEFKKK